MGLGLLTKALKTIGGGDIAKAMIAPAGNAILNGIAKKYNLDLSSPTFDKDAAAAILADRQEANRFVESMRSHDVEAFKAETVDRQDARRVTFSAREKMSLEHQQKIDTINLYEALAMSIGGLLLIMGLLGWLVWLHVDEPNDSKLIPEWLYMLIGTTITFISKDLISVRSQYKHGSTEGSSRKNTIISDVLQREQEEDARQPQRPVIEQIPVQRPVHTPEDDVGVEVYEAISTRRPSDEENIL